MYGYGQRDKRTAEPGGCREAFFLTRIALGVVLPIMFWLLLGMGLVIAALLLLALNPLASLVPIGLLTAGLTYVVIRDRRIQAEMERENRGE